MDLLKLYAFGDLKSGPVQGIWDENWFWQPRQRWKLRAGRDADKKYNGMVPKVTEIKGKECLFWSQKFNNWSVGASYRVWKGAKIFPTKKLLAAIKIPFTKDRAGVNNFCGFF